MSCTFGKAFVQFSIGNKSQAKFRQARKNFERREGVEINQTQTLCKMDLVGLSRPHLIANPAGRNRETHRERYMWTTYWISCYVVSSVPIFEAFVKQGAQVSGWKRFGETTIENAQLWTTHWVWSDQYEF